jgi:hypothetical protein
VLRSAVDASDAPRGRRLARAWTAAIWTAVLAWAPPVEVQARTDLADITIFGWSLNNVRFGVRVSPDYMGSNDYRLAPSGSINFARRGTQPGFGAPDDGASLGLFSGPDWSAGLTGRVRAPRENDHDLRGFEKVDLAAEGGVFAAYWPKDWLRLRGELRRGVGVIIRGSPTWAPTRSRARGRSSRRWAPSIVGGQGLHPHLFRRRSDRSRPKSVRHRTLRSRWVHPWPSGSRQAPNIA